MPPTNSVYTKKNDPRFLDIRTVLAKYTYHWPLFVIGLLLALLVAYAYIKLANPVYEISATILVKDEKKVPKEKSALQELDQSSSPKNAETEIQILKSDNLINRVVVDLQLWVNYKLKGTFTNDDIYKTAPVNISFLQPPAIVKEQIIDVIIKDKNRFETTDINGDKRTYSFNTIVSDKLGKWMLRSTPYTKQYIGSTIKIAINDPEKVTNNYLKSIDVHLLDKATPTIGLFVDDEVPERGKNILNHLIRSYNEATYDEEKRTTASTIEFINKRLASLTGELNTAEKDVEGYRSSQGLTDINSQSQVYLQNVQTNDIKLNEVNVQLNVIEGIERYVNSTSDNENAPATIGISDPALNSLIEKIAQLQLKRSALLATTPIGNPVFEPLDRQIATTKTAIKQTIQSIKSSLLATKRELQSFNNKFESSIKDIPGQERQFVGMKRQQTIKENLYVYLLQKREEVSLSYASTLADARIVDKANVNDLVWPKTPLILAIALIIGLGVPFLIIYIRLALQNKITGKRDIEGAVDARILSEFSQHDAGRAIINDGNSVVSEQFKYLRTNLHYLHQNVKGAGRVTLITSSVSNEGKSFISSNLAVSMANTGRKVIILEMDLRKPTVLEIFNTTRDNPGISDFLASDISIDKIIQHSTTISGLDFIGSGPIPPNPSELLERDKLEQLMLSLREKYDDILIDTPPLHLVTDTLLIARIADVSLYVVRQGHTSKDELEFIREVYEDNKLPKMNIIFNGVATGKYGYGYNYDTSYYTAQKAKPALPTMWKLFLERL